MSNAPAPSPAEQAVIDRFDAAPKPPEVVEAEEILDEVATALLPFMPPMRPMLRREVAREAAAAAIAALPPSPAELAIKRVEAIVEEMEDDESIGIPPHVPLLIKALRAALDPS